MNQAQREILSEVERFHKCQDRNALYAAFRGYAKDIEVDELKKIIQALPAKCPTAVRINCLSTALRAKNCFKQDAEVLSAAVQEEPRNYSLRLIYLRSLVANGDFELAFKNATSLGGSPTATKIKALNILSITNHWMAVREQLDQWSISAACSHDARMLLQRTEMSLRNVNEEQKLPIYCINLFDDSRKRFLIASAYANIAKHVKFHDAIVGRDLPELFVAKINKGPILRRTDFGSIACFLSHIKVLEKIADSSEDAVMIIEDDAVPYYGYSDPPLLKTIKNNAALFVNERMSPIRYSDGGTLDEETFLQIFDQLNYIPNWQPGWGADGYVVTPSGAEEILEQVSQDLILGHFDGQLISYFVDKISENNRALKTASWYIKKRKNKRCLKGLSCYTPRVTQINFGWSSRAANET